MGYYDNLDNYSSEEYRRQCRAQASASELRSMGYERTSYGEWKQPNNPLGFGARIDENGEIDIDIY